MHSDNVLKSDPRVTSCTALSSIFAATQTALDAIIIADLMHLRLLQISGPDTQKFLQGQLTCNVEEVNESQSRLAAHCNLQGRMVSLGRLLKFHNDFYWQVPASIINACLTHLKKYALFSKVKLEILPAEPLRTFGIAGAAAESLLNQLGLPCPARPDEIRSDQQLSVLREQGHLPRFIVYGEPNVLMPLWQTLVKAQPQADVETWRFLDIAAGESFLNPETQSLFLPQELQLDTRQAVSFSKGCYLGQEVIARLHYLGKLKKRLWQIEFEKPQAPGSKMLHADRPTGQLVCSAHFNEKYYGLAVLQTETAIKFEFEDGSRGTCIAAVD